MIEIKNYIWIAILFGGILTLLSIFTPVSYFTHLYEWMWGFGYHDSGDSGSHFYFWLLNEPSQINIPWWLLDFLTALIIFICSLVLIIMGSRIWIGSINTEDKEKKLVIIGILLIIAPIIYVIDYYIFENIYYDYFGIVGDFKLWTGGDSYPGFAFIGPFIGGALVIISVIASKKIKPREVITKTSMIAKRSQLNYCPECGQKLLSKEGKFCTSCRFEINI